MNIKLFTSDNYRENVLKHVRGGSSICQAPRSYSVGDERSCMATRPTLGRGFFKFIDNSKTLSPLPLSNHKRSLSPQPIYSLLSSECFAEELVDELNMEEKS